MSTPSTQTVKSACEWRDGPCSGEPEFILTAHGRKKRICKAGAQRLFTKMRERCFSCRQPKWKCWDITPIEHVEATA